MIQIGKEIKTLLDEACNKVYPLIADQGTTFPFITYRRSGAGDSSSKDSIYEETTNVEIVIVSNNYEESIDIAQKCRDILETARTKKIKKISLADAYEDYQEDSFVQTLIFTIKIIK